MSSSPLTDGNVNTLWTSPPIDRNAKKPHSSFVIDLGAEHRLRMISILWHGEDARCASHAVRSTCSVHTKSPIRKVHTKSHLMPCYLSQSSADDPLVTWCTRARVSGR